MWRAARPSIAVAVSVVACISASDPEAPCTWPTKPLDCTGPQTPQDFIETVLDPAIYDRTQRPLCADRGPTVVEAQFGLTHVNSIDQKLGIIALAGYFRTWWTDPRLKYNDTENGGCFDTVSLNSDQVRKWMWAPDLYIDNLVQKTEDGFASLVYISPGGTIFRSEQVIIEVKSMLDLGRLPYDSHVGKIVVASYSQDVSRLRLKARGGKVGAGMTGVGLKASALESQMWRFNGGLDEGFETPGQVDVLFDGAWDYLTMSFDYSRQPKFLVDQVMMPAILFVLVSYIQFWVDPTAAPARATLAVIPVLIMLTLSSSMYRSLPEGSQRMWLTDNLMILTFLCILAALQFGVVQYCLIKERARANKSDGLKKVADTARLLLRQADGEGKSLLELLTRYKAIEKAGGPTCTFTPEKGNVADQTKTRGSSDDAVAQGIKECDLLFIDYVKKIFDMYDNNLSGTLGPREVRRALTYFNIYIDLRQIPGMLCMFLRDHGQKTPEAEDTMELTSTQFCRLLLEIDKYALRGKTRTIVGYFQSIPPSARWDVVARVFVPVFVTVQQVVMQILVVLY